MTGHFKQRIKELTSANKKQQTLVRKMKIQNEENFNHVNQLEQELVQVAQFHDETINLIEEGSEKETEKKLRWAIDQTNKELSLNRELDIDVQFGDNYSEIH